MSLCLSTMFESQTQRLAKHTDEEDHEWLWRSSIQK